MFLLFAAALPVLVQDAALPPSTVKLIPPTVNLRANRASATTDPWVDSNGWEILRQPDATFYYDVKGKQAALAAAEAYCYSAKALIHTDAAGVEPFNEMLAFLRQLPPFDAPPFANVNLIDDGSNASGEFMNALVRRNLLFRVFPDKAPRPPNAIRIGTSEYPSDGDPYLLAAKLRAKITDDKRLVRIYGTGLVIARLAGDNNHARLHLINYAGATRKVEGIRVRVLGRYAQAHLNASGSPGEALTDTAFEGAATEFTIPELNMYAVIDLSRSRQ